MRSARLVVALALLAAPACAQLCPKSYGGMKLEEGALPGYYPLSSCPLQSDFTCCGPLEDAILSAEGERGEVSTACSTALRAVRCVACDGRAVLESKPVCPSLLQDALGACGEDVFSWEEASGHVAPCTDAALICAPLLSLITSAADLAMKLRVPIASEGEACYDGSLTLPPAGWTTGGDAQKRARRGHDSFTTARRDRSSKMSWGERLLQLAQAAGPLGVAAVAVLVLGAAALVRQLLATTGAGRYVAAAQQDSGDSSHMNDGNSVSGRGQQQSPSSRGGSAVDPKAARAAWLARLEAAAASPADVTSAGSGVGGDGLRQRDMRTAASPS